MIRPQIRVKQPNCARTSRRSLARSRSTTACTVSPETTTLRKYSDSVPRSLLYKNRDYEQREFEVIERSP